MEFPHWWVLIGGIRVLLSSLKGNIASAVTIVIRQLCINGLPLSRGKGDVIYSHLMSAVPGHN
jgi:hypothetical protein